MLGRLGSGELIIVFLVILILFGGKKLPELARGLGEAIREFREAAEPKEKKEKLSQE